jgi:hypothetical protein
MFTQHTMLCSKHACMYTHLCNIAHRTYTQHVYENVNRQARVALGDRIRNSLQLTALRLKPSRLLGVQALTLHYP